MRPRAVGRRAELDDANVTTQNPNNIDPVQIADWDHQYVWHPFTQMKQWADREPLTIVGGQREFLIDARGNRYIDGVSSMWCNVHGHNHPAINEAMLDQIGRISHSTMLGLTSPPAVLLAKRLVEIVPGELAKVLGVGAQVVSRVAKGCVEEGRLVVTKGRPKTFRLG